MIRDRNIFRQEYKHAQGWWEDLVFPPSTLNNAVGTPPDVASDGTLLFAANVTEEVFIQAQMPHKWLEGSEIEPHVHWAKTTSAAGGVVWKIDYDWKNVGETYTGSLGTTLALSDTEGFTNDDTAHKHSIYAADITDATKTVSSIMLIRLYRDHDDAGDTYGADVKLYQFDIHYMIDQPGSYGEYTKWGV